MGGFTEKCHLLTDRQSFRPDDLKTFRQSNPFKGSPVPQHTAGVDARARDENPAGGCDGRWEDTCLLDPEVGRFPKQWVEAACGSENRRHHQFVEDKLFSIMIMEQKIGRRNTGHLQEV
ncbi:hypothetical protein Acid7E03_05070 [Acidisoma sp. 7E03]